jgi:PAS domain S-box-containing protein
MRQHSGQLVVHSKGSKKLQTFILNDPILKFYKSHKKESQIPDGVYDLTRFTLDKGEKDSKTFQVIFPNATSITFEANTRKEKEGWIKVLEQMAQQITGNFSARSTDSVSSQDDEALPTAPTTTAPTTTTTTTSGAGSPQLPTSQPPSPRGNNSSSSSIDISTETLRTNHKFYNHLDHLLESALVCTDNGTIVAINKSACKMFLYEKDQIVGKSINTFLTPEQVSKHDGYFHQVEKNRRGNFLGHKRTVQVLRSDGTPMSINIVITTPDPKEKVYLAMFS